MNVNVHRKTDSEFVKLVIHSSQNRCWARLNDLVIWHYDWNVIIQYMWYRIQLDYSMILTWSLFNHLRLGASFLEKYPKRAFSGNLTWKNKFSKLSNFGNWASVISSRLFLCWTTTNRCVNCYQPIRNQFLIILQN